MDDLTTRLRELEARATPGPWVWYGQTFADKEALKAELASLVQGTEDAHKQDVPLELHGVGVESETHTLYAALTGCGPNSAANAEFLSALRNALPALLSTREQAIREGYERGVREAADACERIAVQSISDHEAGGCYACSTAILALLERK